MNKSIFETKEQYLTFRAAFAAAQNDKRAKHHYVEEAIRMGWGRDEHIVTIKVRHNGWLQAEHFILLNAIRGKPLDRGFTPITNPDKLEYGLKPMRSFEGSLDFLVYKQNLAKAHLGNKFGAISAFDMNRISHLSDEERRAAIEKIIEDKKAASYRQFSGILEPFNGALTIEQFVALDLSVSDQR